MAWSVAPSRDKLTETERNTMNRDTVISTLTNPKAVGYVDSVRPIFKEIPHLPLKVKEILVQIIPWLAILGAVLSAIAGVQYILLAFGIRQVIDPVGSDAYLLIVGILSLVAAYIAFLSFPLLKERNYTGWVLLFWSTVLSVLMSVISLLFNMASIIGVLISAAVGFYLTFEIEELYTASGKVAAKVSETAETVKNTTKAAKKSAKN